MNYNLCKKLKEAGFPQTNQNKVCDGSDLDESGKAIWCSEPSLSELIEACGECLFSLYNEIETAPSGLDVIRYWKARGGGQEERGSTPEEAVANLYLQLHGTPPLPENRS